MSTKKTKTRKGLRLTDAEFRALLSLWMRCDCSDLLNLEFDPLLRFIEREADMRGFGDLGTADDEFVVSK